ncbi:uncharacterized protein BDR25DRAFT_395461 [Lindgomyces ingoldianus]|uniref:Uncharacterized protein n=1 Tax=Lindgomyces ingoldianus TaxID=673940 RepID=A0ACB6QJ63_9PLEO|nr:uncharacterized protein BDR25DRAFT_395461 [Lindgomyces ingoldianus]KAF2466907.1 hypothetical protein BDR25DRAFT_395461 [Lindgomyces ingoldianus]
MKDSKCDYAPDGIGRSRIVELCGGPEIPTICVSMIIAPMIPRFGSRGNWRRLREQRRRRENLRGGTSNVWVYDTKVDYMLQHIVFLVSSMPFQLAAYAYGVGKVRATCFWFYCSCLSSVRRKRGISRCSRTEVRARASCRDAAAAYGQMHYFHSVQSKFSGQKLRQSLNIGAMNHSFSSPIQLGFQQNQCTCACLPVFTLCKANHGLASGFRATPGTGINPTSTITCPPFAISLVAARPPSITTPPNLIPASHSITLYSYRFIPRLPLAELTTLQVFGNSYASLLSVLTGLSSCARKRISAVYVGTKYVIEKNPIQQLPKLGLSIGQNFEVDDL